MEVLNKKTSEALLTHQEELAQVVVARQYKAQPELFERYGEIGRKKCFQDLRYHVAYLAEAMAASSPELFGNYLDWTRSVLEQRGVLLKDLTKGMYYLLDALYDVLPQEMHPVVYEYLERGLAELPEVAAPFPTFIDVQTPHGDLARQYLDMLLSADRYGAIRLIMDAVESGISVKDIYLHIFQPVQHEIGRLWQLDEISVAHEHYATAVTQLVMSQLYPYIFATQKNGRRLVATCVGGELHEIGVRMVADFFEMAGWDTFYLGANTPVSGIVQAVLERQADILAISATMTVHIRSVQALITAIRASEAGTVKILVGGYPFNAVPDLWQQMGADGYAPDAESAIAVATHILQ